MRFSVRRLHVCAGKEKRTLRKGAFCAGTLTEKRILDQRRHRKAHFGRALSLDAIRPSRKSAPCAPRSPRHRAAPCAPRSPRHRAAPCAPRSSRHRAAPCGSHATHRHPALYPVCTAMWVITSSTHPDRDARPQLGTQTITRLDGILSRRLGPLDRITSRRAYSMARPCSGLL